MFDNIFIITTYQYPHLEHFNEDINFLVKNNKKVCVINLVPTLQFRSCLYANSFRRYLGTRYYNTFINNRVRLQIKDIKEKCNLYLDLKEERLIDYIGELDLEKITNNSAIDYLRVFKKSYFIDKFTVEILKKKIKQSIYKFYNPLKQIIEDNMDANVHIFSGRFPIESFIVNNICQNNQIIYYESNDFNCNVLRKLCNTNLLNNYQEDVKEIKEKYDKYKLISALNQLIKYRRKGKIKSNNKYDFIFYTTSLDEILSFGGIPDQLSILKKFAKVFEGNAKAVIRMHPNTRNKPKYDRDYWDYLEMYFKSFGISVISYKDNIDSYSLHHQESVSFSVGSTITGELLFMDFKSILIGEFTYYSKFIGNNIIQPEYIFRDGFLNIKSDNNNFDKSLLASSLLIEYLRGEDFENKKRDWITKDAQLVYDALGIITNDKFISIGLTQNGLLDL